MTKIKVIKDKKQYIVKLHFIISLYPDLIIPINLSKKIITKPSSINKVIKNDLNCLDKSMVKYIISKI